MFHNRRMLGAAARRPFAAAVGYQGPGDIVSGAAGWWGLRAYNAAAATSGLAAVRLRDAADLNSGDIHLLSNGSLNLSEAFFGSFSGPYTIETLYDQSGGGKHILGSTRRPKYASTGNGLTVPNMGFIAASGLFLNLGASTFSLGGFPFTFNAVYRHTASASPQCLIQLPTPGGTALNAAGTPASAYMNNGGGFPQATAADGSWHTAQAIFTNSTSDTINVDNTNINNITGSTSAGSSVPSSSDIYVGSDPASSHLDGFMAEIGVWPVGFTAPQQTAMYNNQHNYYTVF